jgi:hypothetical protein
MDQLPHCRDLLSIDVTYDYPSGSISVSQDEGIAPIFQILSLGNVRKRNHSTHHIRNLYRSITDFFSGLSNPSAARQPEAWFGHPP